jgi:hypothetical protein
MEPLGSAATVFAVVSLADQLANRVKQLYTFWSAVNDAPNKITAIATDLKLLISVLVQTSNHSQRYGVNNTTVDMLSSCK